MNNPQIYDAICSHYFNILSQARTRGYTEDIEIHIREDLANELELGDTLTVGFGDCIIENVPIVIDNSIKKKPVKNSSATISNIYLFDPKWFVEK